MYKRQLRWGRKIGSAPAFLPRHLASPKGLPRWWFQQRRSCLVGEKGLERIDGFSMHSYGECIFNLQTFQPTDTIQIRIKFVGRDSTVLFYPGFELWRGRSSFAYSIETTQKGIATLELAFSATLDTVPSPPYRACCHSLSRLKDA